MYCGCVYAWLCVCSVNTVTVCQHNQSTELSHHKQTAFRCFSRNHPPTPSLTNPCHLICSPSYLRCCHFEICQCNHRICKPLRLLKFSQNLERFIRADAVITNPSSVWLSRTYSVNASNCFCYSPICRQLDCFRVLVITENTAHLSTGVYTQQHKFRTNGNESPRSTLASHTLTTHLHSYWPSLSDAGGRELSERET